MSSEVILTTLISLMSASWRIWWNAMTAIVPAEVADTALVIAASLSVGFCPAFLVLHGPEHVLVLLAREDLSLHVPHRVVDDDDHVLSQRDVQIGVVSLAQLGPLLVDGAAHAGVVRVDHRARARRLERRCRPA